LQAKLAPDGGGNGDLTLSGNAAVTQTGHTPILDAQSC
jgi:hypothetical protein